MPKPKPSSARKKATKQPPFLVRVKQWTISVWRRSNERRKAFLSRRPHRSFQLSRRRDYVRSLEIPGYIAFTGYVNRMLWARWRLFVSFTIILTLVSVVLGAVTSQEVYATVNGLLTGAADSLFDGGLSQLGQAGLIALATFASTSTNLAADQAVYLGISLLLCWLSTVWLLRETLAGRRPKLRDALYNAGAPILSTVCVLLIMLVQLLPIGVVMLVYAGLSAIGLAGEGFGAMLFWLFAAVVAALVLYWMASTIIALVVVTIPGMYPMRALRLSGDLVVGRRMRVFLRLLWGIAIALVGWALILVIMIVIDNLIKTIWSAVADFSAVPYIGALVSAFAIVWFAAYVYLFYRKVVDDDASPA